MATNYSENLFNAVQILIDKSLESVKFDETINAIIVDASKAKNGQYTVSNGATDFVAYSTVTDYRKNDAVMVTIPQGNYDNQKIIIGKQVTKDNTPLVYKSPMENMVNLTNNLIPDNSNLKVEMWANSSDYAWEENVKLSESKLYTTPIAEGSNVLKYCIWDSNDCNTEFFYQKYDVLGLSAQFSTWLNEYNTITGNYGLILEVTFKDLNAQENFVKIYSCQFDSSEFFGDIYNFETYYTQEKVFDLSDYKDSAIVRLRLFPYQRCNFTTIEGEDVPYPNEDDFSNIPPNIYMKDFMISLGSYSSEITEDTAEIMTDSSMAYDKNIQDNLFEYDPIWITNYLLGHKELLLLLPNTESITYNLMQLLKLYNSGVITKIEHREEFKRLLQNYGDENILNNLISFIMHENSRENNNLKYINLRWVHIFENEIKVVQENEIPENYEIRWYRYMPGAPAPDQFAGVHWEYLAAAGEESSTLNKITVEFQPDVNKNEEKIKVIIVKKENNKEYKIATSNILEFHNNTEIRDTVTLKDAQALYLRPDDQFNGKYLIYNRNHKISQKAWYTQYTITAMFNPELDGLGSVLSAEDCSQIIWSLPKNNSMITPDTSAINVTEDDNYYYYSSENNDKKLLITIPYFIKNVLNNAANNNTISLNIVKDGLEYFAAFNFIFGIAGTNGSDYTIKVIWNKNAIDVNPTEGKPDVLTGEMILVDKDGQSVDLSKAKVQVEWATALDWDKTQRIGSKYVFEQETEDLYFPVYFTDATLNSCQSIYYFIDGTSDRQPQYTNTTTRNYFFFKDTLNNNNYDDYYYYDLNSKKFIKWNKSNKTDSFYTTAEAFNNATEQDAFGPIYRKKRDNEEAQNAPKYKITFKEIKVIPGEETGEFYNTYKSGFSWSNGKISSSQSFQNTFKEENGKRVAAYYNYRRRYFVYKDGQYILDPWGGFNENEVYYEPILQPPTIRDDLSNSTSSLSCECTRIDDKKFGINITYGQNDIISLNSIYILKIIIKNFGDYNLISHEPIALKTGKRDNGEILTAQSSNEANDYNLVITNISCPTSVRYSTTGEVDIDYKDPFQISGMKVKDTTFSPITHFFEQTNGVTTTHILKGYWRLLIGEKINENFNPANKSNQFNPSLIETAQNKDDQGKSGVITQRIRNTSVNINGVENSFNWLVYQSPLLKPPAIYYKDAAPYAIQFVIFDASNQKPDQVVWTQPICVFQDNYPSTTLNNWNGKDIVTDNDSGTIVANGFAAGHKNSDNTFSGVVLGDWSRTDIDPSVTNPPGSTYSEPMTGVYGFNHGAMSYALKDDGTAFFGKDGRGRIYFNGNNATIQSASWNFNNPNGMKIDLDDGILDTRSQNSQVYISPNSNKLLNIKTTYNKQQKDILFISDNSYYLQTANFDDSNNLGTNINLKTGKIKSYNFELDTIKTYDNEKNLKKGIILNSNPEILVRYDQEGETPFYLMRLDTYGDNFYLKSKDYNVDKKKGTLINLRDGIIQSYGFTLNAFQSQNDEQTALQGIYLSSAGPKFQVRSDIITENNDNSVTVTPQYLINIDNAENKFYLKSKNYDATNKTGTLINLRDGIIRSYGFTLDAYTSDGKKWVALNSGDANYPLKIGTIENNKEEFKVTWNGALKLKGSKGNGTITLDSSGDSNTNPLEIKTDDDHQFYVDWNGIMHSTGAQISGNITATSGEIGGWRISSGMGLEKNISASDSPDGQKYDTVIRSNPWGWNSSAGNFSPNSDESNFGLGYAFAVYKSNNPLFYVNYKGLLYAKNADISGKITADSGTIGSWGISTHDEKYLEKEKTVSDSNSGFIRLGGTTYGINVNGKFKVDYSGNMTATSGTFSGDLEAAGGTFTGTLSGVDGTFTGTLSAAGGTFKGKLVAASGSFSGDVTANTLSVKQDNGISMGNSKFYDCSLTIVTYIETDESGKITHIKTSQLKFLSTDSVGFTHTGGCFIAGTKISMANGTFKNIEDIQKNDLILAYDENKNNYVIGKVLRTKKNNIFTKVMKLTLSNNNEIIMTLSHPILTIKGWKAIDYNTAFIEHGIICEKLTKKDQIITQNGIYNIKNIIEYDYNLPVYNFAVEKYHTYIANNCIVHNSVVVTPLK